MGLINIEEDALVGRYVLVTRSQPVGLRDTLHILTHPDVKQFTFEYIYCHMLLGLFEFMAGRSAQCDS